MAPQRRASRDGLADQPTAGPLRWVQLYLHAVAVTLAAWGPDDDDPHWLDRRTHAGCRVAIAQARKAIVTGRESQMHAAEEALRKASASAHEARARAELLRPTAIEHVLAAPALAQLTAERLARHGDSKIDLDALRELVEDAGESERVLEQLVWRLHGQPSCDLTVDQLLELDDENLRRALEGIALSRGLWGVGPDWRWLELAEAEQCEHDATAAHTEDDAM